MGNYIGTEEGENADAGPPAGVEAPRQQPVMAEQMISMLNTSSSSSSLADAFMDDVPGVGEDGGEEEEDHNITAAARQIIDRDVSHMQRAKLQSRERAANQLPINERRRHCLLPTAAAGEEDEEITILATTLPPAAGDQRSGPKIGMPMNHPALNENASRRAIGSKRTMVTTAVGCSSSGTTPAAVPAQQNECTSMPKVPKAVKKETMEAHVKSQGCLRVHIQCCTLKFLPDSLQERHHQNWHLSMDLDLKGVFKVCDPCKLAYTDPQGLIKHQKSKTHMDQIGKKKAVKPPAKEKEPKKPRGPYYKPGKFPVSKHFVSRSQAATDCPPSGGGRLSSAAGPSTSTSAWEEEEEEEEIYNWTN